MKSRNFLGLADGGLPTFARPFSVIASQSSGCTRSLIVELMYSKPSNHLIDLPTLDFSSPERTLPTTLSTSPLPACSPTTFQRFKLQSGAISENSRSRM